MLSGRPPRAASGCPGVFRDRRAIDLSQ